MLAQYGYDLFDDFSSQFIHKFVSRFTKQRSFQDLHSFILSSVRNRLHGVNTEPEFFKVSRPLDRRAQPLVSIGALQKTSKALAENSVSQRV